MARLLLFINPRFMLDFWTTVGRTVYVPTKYDKDFDWGTEPWRRRHHLVIDHEQVHIDQLDRHGWLAHGLLYIGPSPYLLGFGLGLAPLLGPMALFWMTCAAAILAPLTAGLAWGRWSLEREAYLVEVRALPPGPDRDARIERIADSLWYNYFYSWPRSWAITWFKRNA
jgi:hypothetical protein